MRTETTTRTIYSARELREHHPRGFERAHEQHCRWVAEDPAWANEHRDSLSAALDAIGHDDLPDIEGPRRVMAWAENHVLSQLRIGYTGKERWRVSQFGPGYRPGCIRPCPWTGYCVDDDLLDVIKAEARAGTSPKDIVRAVKARADRLWEDETDSQCTADYFIENAEANGYEYDERGNMI